MSTLTWLYIICPIVIVLAFIGLVVVVSKINELDKDKP